MRDLPALLILALCIAVPAFAAPTVDGTKDPGYGAPLAVQTVETGFGDNLSELNAAFGLIDSGRLYLMLTGNIEANFNKLEVFIDSKPGGQAVFNSSGNDNAAAMDGLVFDAGFTADYHLILRRGDSGGPRFDLDFADLGAQSASGYFDFLAGGGTEGVGTTGTGVNASVIEVGYNNSNVAGIGGNPAFPANQAAATAVATGVELGIALSDIGYVGGPLHVMVGVNNTDHNYWSNQFLAGLPAPQGNLGGDESGGFTGEGAIDLNHFSGNQFFTVAVPEPSAVTLLALAAGLLASRRRRL